jgi:hypothetical protein
VLALGAGREELRDPQARARWIDTAMVRWLITSVEGRRLLAHMRRLPAGVAITIEPGGTWSSRTDLSGRTEETSALGVLLGAAGTFAYATVQDVRAVVPFVARRRLSPTEALRAA